MKKPSIGKVILGDKPRIAGVITDPGHDLPPETIADLDLLELRMDYFPALNQESLVAAADKFRLTGVPLLATIRTAREGGRGDLTELEREKLFRAIIPFVDAIDIELNAVEIRDAVIGDARLHDKTVIVSCHNFILTPEENELEEIVTQGREVAADIVKIAAMVNDRQDLIRLMKLTAAHNNLITLAMGSLGSISRVLFPLMGSLLTYGAITEASAPGQMGVRALRDGLNMFGIKDI